MDEYEKRPGDVLRQQMEIKGIPRSLHVSRIAKILDISPTQAYRKLKGISSWEVNQLLTVLDDINFPPHVFFSLINPEIENIHRALFNEEQPCQIYLLSNNQISHEYVGFLKHGTWFCFHKNKIPDHFSSSQQYAIARVELGIIYKGDIEITKKTIAILDDDPSITKSLELLFNHDYEIMAFNSLTDIETHIERTTIDAYILDWDIDGKNCHGLINSIRNSPAPDTPILILTGKGCEVDADIARVIEEHDIIGPYQKPVRTDVIKSQLKRLFIKHERAT